MPKKILKKEKPISPSVKFVLEKMKGKIPVECPGCFIQLLRDPKNLKEKCGNCLKEVTYKILK